MLNVETVLVDIKKVYICCYFLQTEPPIKKKNISRFLIHFYFILLLFDTVDEPCNEDPAYGKVLKCEDVAQCSIDTGTCELKK